MISRALLLGPDVQRSFFLWGPRQSGKSTLLREVFPNALKIDLLRSTEFVKYSQRPDILIEELNSAAPQTLVIIDEIQKVPPLLDSVHWLIENKQIIFGLCGSSARKLKQGQANLLGGRALRFELRGLVSAELKTAFNLQHILNVGYLPSHYLVKDDAKALIRSYVSDYLKEEIAAEGLVRNLPSFSSFLEYAALSDTEVINFSTFARDVGVSSHTIRGYFDILQDTLLGQYLPSFTKRPKRKVTKAPKFYFSDVGVVNFLAKRKDLEPKSSDFGKAFENWIFHELRSYSLYHKLYFDMYYWGGSTEVDFIIGDMEFAIEAKAIGAVHGDHLKGLRLLAEAYPNIKRRIVVSLDAQKRRTSDGIEIIPYQEFVKDLWSGQLLN